MSRRLLSNALGVKYGGYRLFLAGVSSTIPGHWGHTIVSTNSSGASITLTLPTIAQLNNKLVTVSVRQDPAGNFVKLVESDGSTEVWTGYALGDFCTITSNGAGYDVIAEDSTVYGYLALTSPESISANSSQKVFDVNYSEETDVGGWWDAVTNHRLTAAYPCLLQCTGYFEGAATIPMVMELLVNGTASVNKAAGGSTGEHATYHSWQLELAASDTVVVNAFNDSSSNQNLVGAAGKQRTQFRWNVIRRIR